MTTICSRRDFLRSLGALTGLFLMNRTGIAALADGSGEPFEILVIGDSMIWGQGLREEDKIYSLVHRWVETEVFGGKRPVGLKNKSHSGATIILTEKEGAAVSNGLLDETKTLHPEIPVGFPTVNKQIDIARSEYRDPGDVKLIILSAGIADIAVVTILNVFSGSDEFKKMIPKYCYEETLKMLEHAAAAFPNATIVVTGYYPMVSKKSSTKKVFNAIFETYDFPDPVKPLMNNVLTRPILKIIHGKIVKRSDYWAVNSDLLYAKAVEDFNAKARRNAAVFVKAPVNSNNTFGTKEPLIWDTVRKNRVPDPIFDERGVACRKDLADILASAKLKYARRFCEVAALGHPNPAGARAYAEAIQAKLNEIGIG